MGLSTTFDADPQASKMRAMKESGSNLVRQTYNLIGGASKKFLAF
jgi:hypothetical protein